MLDCNIYRTKYGVFKVPANDMFICEAFKSGKHWEEDILKVLIDIFSNTVNKDYINVGSHVGTTAVPISKYFNTTYCFEPQKRLNDILIDNLKNNKCKCVIVKQAVISNSDNTFITMSDKDFQGNDVNGKIVNHGGVCIGKNGECVLSQKLDSLDNIEPSFISIDAEGSEQSVILSALRTIEEHKPIIMVEMNYVTQTEDMIDSLGKEETLNIDEYLTSNGYESRIDLGDYNYLYIPKRNKTLDGSIYIDQFGNKFMFTESNYHQIDDTNIVVVFNKNYVQHGVIVEDKILWSNFSQWTLL